MNKVGATHSAARVSGLGFFHHRGSQDTDIIGCSVHYIWIIHFSFV
jgi:hypothetical protein